VSGAEPPNESAPGDVTLLLRAWQAGDASALDKLLPVVYQGLRRLASQQMRGERANHTLEPTALVHEAFLRLTDRRADWQNRRHFFAVAAQTMRRVAVDYARARVRRKRGGNAVRVDLTAAVEQASVEPRSADVLDLDRALQRLESLDPQQAQLVELRFFAGLSIEECAETLGVSPVTVWRQWRLAKAFLFRELSGGA
jgi:RNA polymerase sigma factor (TIGR02999 family)